ncbi:MAG: hypothetical protein IKX25_07670 [Bacteroidales bacterium]|nr:hypothetical protein [Bacteroidales bacterium]
MEKEKQTVRNTDEMAANGLSFSEIRKVVSDQIGGYGGSDGMSVMKLVQLLGSAITGKKEEYKLSFDREEEYRWYIDFPNWPWKKANLEMVSGADKLLDILSKGRDRVTVLVKPSSKPMDEAEFQKLKQDGWLELTQIQSSLTGGATYTARGNNIERFVRRHPLTGEVSQRTLWLCPVTLFVVGRYPKYFYVKAIEE